MNAPRRVVVTGVGVVSPIGIGAENFWNALVDQRSGVGPVRAFDPAAFQSRIGAEIPELDVRECVPKHYRKSTKIMARDIEIAVVAAYDAVRHARLRTRCLIDRGEAEPPPEVDPTRLGANIGAGLICADLRELAGALASAADEAGRFDIRRWGSEGMNNLTPLWLLKFLPNMLACHVTIVHDAQAVSNTITCGEASSHLAVGEAFRTIARGSADVCLCGGAESEMNPMGMMRQELFGRLVTTCNDDPPAACRPFDHRHCGTVVGEGGGILVLEDLDHARRRSAPLLAEIVGFGASSNTHDWATPDPTGGGLALACHNALRDAGIGPEDIDLICAFGTGIPEFDCAEARAFHQVFGERIRSVPVMAIKWAVGNNGAGSGAMDLAAALMAMRHNTVPGTPNLERVDPECDLRVIGPDPVDLRPRHVLTVAYALGGGQNAALVFRRAEEAAA